MRTEGDSPTRSIDPHSQGAALFRLKSQLFSRVVLAGTFEIAVYPPPEGHVLPAIAAAAAFTSRGIHRGARGDVVARAQPASTEGRGRASERVHGRLLSRAANSARVCSLLPGDRSLDRPRLESCQHMDEDNL
jgi:hypothetical protein